VHTLTGPGPRMGGNHVSHCPLGCVTAMKDAEITVGVEPCPGFGADRAPRGGELHLLQGLTWLAAREACKANHLRLEEFPELFADGHHRDTVKIAALRVRKRSAAVHCCQTSRHSRRRVRELVAEQCRMRYTRTLGRA
jgi:hypothetical protein